MHNRKVKIVPIGGFGEIGKNSFVVETNRDMVVVDAGVLFPNKEEHPGVSKIAPDFEYIVKRRKKLRAILITHGHEDHIGSLVHLLQELGSSVPIYATRFTRVLIKHKFSEANMKEKVIEMNPDLHEETKLGNTLFFEPFRVTHSIPDAVGLAFRTPAGLIVHTGDFKIDNTPIKGPLLDIDKLHRFRQEGVRALICDTTSALHKGMSPSESNVLKELKPLIHRKKGTVFISMFASNLHRIEGVLQEAEEAGRKVIVAGMSMEKNIIAGLEANALEFPAEKLIPADDFDLVPDDERLVIATGSQGEPMGALARIAGGTHKTIRLNPSDSVVLSANPIPGNEKAVNDLINGILAQGVAVYHPRNGYSVHASGHGHEEDVRWMIRLVQPELLLPFHGEEVHIKAFKEIATQMGYGEEQIITLRLGHYAEISEEEYFLGEGIKTGSALVDGNSFGIVGNQLLNERLHIRDEGVVFAVVALTHKEKRNHVEVITRGVFYDENSPEIADSARRTVESVVRQNVSGGNFQALRLKADIQIAMANFFYKKTGRRPMVIPVVLET